MHASGPSIYKKEKDVSMKNKQQDELNRKPHTTTGYIYILPNQDESRIPAFWTLHSEGCMHG
jgi:hypothetical protein